MNQLRATNFECQNGCPSCGERDVEQVGYIKDGADYLPGLPSTLSHDHRHNPLAAIFRCSRCDRQFSEGLTHECPRCDWTSDQVPPLPLVKEVLFRVGGVLKKELTKKSEDLSLR